AYGLGTAGGLPRHDDRADAVPAHECGDVRKRGVRPGADQIAAAELLDVHDGVSVGFPTASRHGRRRPAMRMNPDPSPCKVRTHLSASCVSIPIALLRSAARNTCKARGCAMRRRSET